MKRVARALGVLILSTAPGGVGAESGSAEKYSSYYEALRARDRGDCDGVVRNLNTFLQDYPQIREKYPDFYLDLKFAISECMPGGLGVHGIGESTEIDPLPNLPPMED
jgi:hypothetical protein